MTKAKKELLSKAPWRGEDDDESNKFKDAKLKVTSQPGSTPTMHVPRKKSQRFDDEDDDDQALEIDPELRYSFQRNFQVFLSLHTRSLIIGFFRMLNFFFIECELVSR
jgi:hypothetical protein